MAYITDSGGWGSGSAAKQATPQQGITAAVSFSRRDVEKLLAARAGTPRALKAMTAPDLAASGSQRQLEVWRLAKGGDQAAALLWKQFKRWYPGRAKQAKQLWKGDPYYRRWRARCVLVVSQEAAVGWA